MSTTRPPFSTVAPFSTVPPFSTTTPPMEPSGRPTPAAGNDLSMKDLVELVSQGLLIIRAKWYWGLLGALLIGGSLGYVLFTRPTEVTAQTALLAQSTLDRVIGNQTDSGGSDQARENNLRNHLSMMTSRKFRTRLLKAFTPAEKAQIAAPYLQPGETADESFFMDFFENKIAIERERGREYYTVSVRHIVPESALMIADRFAGEYLSHVQSEYRDANVHGYDLLGQQAEAIRTELARVENERLDFRKKNGIISRADNQGILAERLKRLDASLTEVRIKRVGLETQAKQARIDREKSAYPWDNAYLASFANNEGLRQELDRQLAARAVLASRYGPNHSKMRDIDSQIVGIQANITRNFDVAVRDLEAQLDIVTRTEKLLQKEFDDAFDSSIEIEKLASTYEILGTGVESKKLTLDQLEKKISDASISSKLPSDFMQIVDPAYLAARRIPVRAIYALIVLAFAGFAFVTIPLGMSLLDARISGTSDVEKVVGLSLVGAIPALKLRIEDRAHVVRNRIDVVTSEAFLGIIGSLEIASVARSSSVVLVTSTLPGEGKSLIASNLASAYQQLGKKTVLVDLDLRRPTQHSLQGIALEGGFLSWAKANFPMENLLEPSNPLSIRTLVDGVSLIAAGGTEAQPSHFFIAKQMAELLQQLQSRYDVVIIDTAPAGVFQDALVLGRYATERMLVAREGVAPVLQIKKVIEDFTKARLAFNGLLLNGFSPRTANKKLAYGYQAASKGYSYGTPKASKRPTFGRAAKIVSAKA